MSGDLAIIMDVAGTILRMYRVAKDIRRGIMIEKIVTWELIMEKKGRALVVPQINPERLASCCPDDPLNDLVLGREDSIEISCSSTPVSVDTAIDILRRSTATIRDLQEVYQVVSARCPSNYLTAGMIVDEGLHSVIYTLSTGGAPFPGLKEVLDCLKDLGTDVYVASGDSRRSLAHLQDLGFDLERVYSVTSPKRKAEIVMELKKNYSRVVMIGDGLNDIYALRAADVGVLTLQQDTRPPPQLLSAADKVIRNINELPEIVRRLL
ncbi:MAG: HAD family hydrolase [Methanothrix sp.]|nr:MAG: HAD family hydrolase [Methanothrix sp.]